MVSEKIRIYAPSARKLRKTMYMPFTCSNGLMQLQAQFKKILFWKLKSHTTTEKELWKRIKQMDPAWLRIEDTRQNNEVTEETDFLIVETLRGWAHINMKKDLPLNLKKEHHHDKSSS